MARGKLSFGGSKFLQKSLVFLGKPLYLLFVTIVISTSIVVVFIKKTISVPKNISLTGKDFLIVHLLRQSNKSNEIKKNGLHKLLGLILVFIIILVLPLLVISKKVFDDLPSVDDVQSLFIPASSKIFDSQGNLLYTLYRDENRTPILLKDIPLTARMATLAAEDADFYNHPGISFKGIIRAFFHYAKTGEVTGGSTITQQLAKNIYLSPEKTISRKLKEMVLALELEKKLTKDQILEMYLNEVPYGGTAYGIEEASLVYFNKHARDLTLSEAAFLAGLPKSPTRFSPFIRHSEQGVSRQKEVLSLMLEHNFISQDEAKNAISSPLTFAENKTQINAPHFIDYVRQELTDILSNMDIEQAGLTVKTTLDPSIQNIAQEKTFNEVKTLAKLHVSNGAALVINPQTGAILAMVGSKNYYDTTIDGFVNVTTRERQPGSSIKLINYAYALSHGYTPATIIDDAPATFISKGTKPYTPQNYDGRYRGNLTLRSAFAESRNVPAVKVLNSYGVSHMIQMGQEMGIKSWVDPSQYGLSLTLGGGDVTLLELSQAYEVVANVGTKVPLHAIEEITDSKGNTLYLNNCSNQNSHFAKSNNCAKTQVLDPRVAYQLIDILKDNNARTPAFGPHSALVIDNHPEVAVKTGTSNSLKDNLTFGFNQNFLVATWVGNNDSSPMSHVASGVTGASPIWNKIMTELLKDKPSVAWSIPDGLIQTKAGCSNKMEWFLKENVIQNSCSSELAKDGKEDKKL